MHTIDNGNKGKNKHISDFFSFQINTDFYRPKRKWRSGTQACVQAGSGFAHAPTGEAALPP